VAQLLPSLAGWLLAAACTMRAVALCLASIGAAAATAPPTIVHAPSSAAFAPGIARPALPTLGWRSWNWFAGDATQAVMEAQAEAMTKAPAWSAKSLFDLGFTHVGLDDEWQSCTGPKGSFHDPRHGGNPMVNFTKFPSLGGMVAKATKLGLSSGFYGDNCRCHAGEKQAGRTHYRQDTTLTLASGFTGYKVDSCGNQRDMTQYAALFAAANATILVESCGNGPVGTNPKEDLPPRQTYLEQLETTCPYSFYRVSVDLGPQFYSCVYNLNRALPFLHETKPLSRPGCWAYADMLMVGVSVPRHSGKPPHDPHFMNFREWRSHFAMWAVTSSPLIIGFDMTNTTLLKATWPIIANEEVLAISQVWEGHPGRLVANSSAYKIVDTVHGSPGTQFTTEKLPSWQAWVKPVANGAVALLVVHVWKEETKASPRSFSLAELFHSPPHPGRAATPPTSVTVRDVFAHTDLGMETKEIKIELSAISERDAVFLVLTPP
jgi:hypothetical protein